MDKFDLEFLIRHLKSIIISFSLFDLFYKNFEFIICIYIVLLLKKHIRKFFLLSNHKKIMILLFDGIY